VPLTSANHGEEFSGDIRRLTMHELSTNELDKVIGGTDFLSPGVYLEEVSVKMISIPGVSTSTGQQTYVAVAHKVPFHWR
jgi:bacteriocin-like protein